MKYMIGLGQVLNRDFIVTAESLNVRKEPTTKSQIVSRLKKGQVVRIFSRQGTWGSTVNGWVSMNYLREATATSKQEGTTQSPQPPQMPQGELLNTIDTYEVISNSNVFERPNGRVIFTLRKGERFKIAGKNREGTWGLIEPTRSRKSGWIALNAQVRLLSSVEPKALKTSKTKQSNLPSWIPERFRNSIEAATNWLRDQVVKIFGNEKEIDRMIKNLTIQYEAVDRLIKNGKVKADSILVQTQKEVGDFLSRMKAEAQKLNEKGVDGIGALPISGVVVLVAGLAAGVVTLQTIQRMRQVEVQRESELRKFSEYEDFKKRTGGTSKTTIEALFNSTAQPSEPQQAGLFAGLGSGIQNIATIGLIGAGGFVVYNLINQKR